MPTKSSVDLLHKDSAINQPGTTIDAYERGYKHTEVAFFGNREASSRGKPRGMLQPELTKKKTKIRNKVLKRAADSTVLVAAVKDATDDKVYTGRPGFTHGDVFNRMPPASDNKLVSGFRHTRSGEFLTRAEAKSHMGVDETFDLAESRAGKKNPFGRIRRGLGKTEAQKITRQRKNTEKAFSTINKKMADPSTTGTMKQALIRRRGVIKNLSRKAGLLGAVMNTGQAFSAAKDASKEKDLTGRLWSFSEKFLGLPEEARRRYGPPKKRDLNI
jgi:hypothetical protein